jgi:small subunit ribosomal protein S6
MNRNYEMISILNPELTENNLKDPMQTAEKIINKFKGEVFSVEEWGKRRLAYPIQKFAEGYYFQLNFNGPHEMVKEIQRVLKLNEQVLRFQIIQVKESPEVAGQKSEEIEEVEKEQEKAEGEVASSAEEVQEVQGDVAEEVSSGEETSEESSETDTVAEEKNE